MYEVILYAIVATIVCAILYSVLGKSVGQGPESGFDPSSLFKSQPETPNSAVSADGVEFEKMPELQAIARADSSFTVKYFVDGAKAAYSLILEGFASGDKDELKSLLTPAVYKVYAAAIKSREADGLIQVTDLGRLISAEIVSAKITGKTGFISVKFEAELASALLDGQGEPVQGDPDLLSHITEIWTFERQLDSNEPNWLLSDVAPSEGDTLEADPTPDTSAPDKKASDKKASDKKV